MRTYRLLQIAVVVCCAMAFVSCGDDDPSGEDDGKITRVQDGDGKAFLEDGKLVDANLKYTRELRDSAFSHYDWTYNYVICYDNKRISGKIKDIENYTFPDSIGSDSTMRFNGWLDKYMYSYEIEGRKIIAEMIYLPWYSYIDVLHTIKVVAIDISGDKGRIIIDEKHEIKGFSSASSYVRVVLRGKKVK